MNLLGGWENFYVIMGSAAGALIGLQFVVMTLIADRVAGAGHAEAGGAFATPTVVHFGAVLLLSGIVSAPWPGVSSAATVWGLMGAVGMVYEIIVVRRMRLQKMYKPELEDWLFHGWLPFVAYTILAGSSYAIRSSAPIAMFGVGAAALLLLFIGIHNAWDAVTYHIFTVRKHAGNTDQRTE